MPMILAAYAVAAIIIAQTVLYVVKSHLRHRKMHPGPPGLPVLGNALQVPTTKPWYQFAEWRKQYGNRPNGETGQLPLIESGR
ncbi:hypothetical protein C8R43DRAFT_981016 [Mycena crocata]|nr:hypothetical protein C8R43DRAFT_981016 [Mycena crocata]